MNLPQPVWLILLALTVGLASGLNGVEVVRAFSSGFGRILGDFALVLLPSFVLAAGMARQQLEGADRVASAISPLTAAGMVCPDTSYATLASVAERRKLSVAFGSGAGYRLLFPAGPLIVATGLGVNCHPCLEHHLAECGRLGINRDEVKAAVEAGLAVNRGAAAKTRDKADALLSKTADCMGGARGCGYGP